VVGIASRGLLAHSLDFGLGEGARRGTRLIGADSFPRISRPGPYLCRYAVAVRAGNQDVDHGSDPFATDALLLGQCGNRHTGAADDCRLKRRILMSSLISHASGCTSSLFVFRSRDWPRAAAPRIAW
jgi:hypothetical protein